MFEAGAEGIGLFRTEMLFMDRDAAPSEEEQGRPVIIRTFDMIHHRLFRSNDPLLLLAGANWRAENRTAERIFGLGRSAVGHHGLLEAVQGIGGVD